MDAADLCRPPKDSCDLGRFSCFRRVDDGLENQQGRIAVAAPLENGKQMSDYNLPPTQARLQFLANEDILLRVKKISSSEVLTLVVDPCTMVEELKAKIETAEGMSPT
ncbi:unnamed protein product [Dibothriocephalus latus]|uniref:Ubiquitin-like domain-containing protein n=1 Tax=Dibothriocephalus latus TaxID=60516 RepID=A0A3P6U124_DIBLA|nr:unnamed protein product [Dibothriocephalus latus]